ncbi:MAG TPA: sugar ABC transporter permease [Candidatus Limnocylindrales bacterium]|nr:sugar ABC transporter permease [Candidatus Limnocylindrales bacterium]
MTATIEELEPATPPGRTLTFGPALREALWGYAFVAPWLIGLVLFTAGPMLASLVMSVTDFNLVKPEATRFVGLDNYARLASDPTIAQSLVATLKFAVITIPVTMVASLGFAVLLNHPRLAFKGPLRALVYMPVMIPLVASTLVWLGFLNTETGWLNAILGAIGLPRIDWINSEAWVYPALTIMGLWGIGNFMLINIAGLQSVPTELYEAARMDGAGAWTQFRRITIPLMSPVLLYNLVIILIGTFQYFTQAFVITNGRGDPNNATLFMNLVLYREGFVYNHMGYAAAIAWLLFVIVLALTLVLFGFARRRVYYAGGER